MNTSPEIQLDTRHGQLQVTAGQTGDGVPWIVLYKKPWGPAPFLRIHSSCVFSESFGGLDCDCSMQLSAALGEVAQQGGALVYLYQEGRGLGLIAKIRGMKEEQVHEVDTAEAYRRLGFELDPRRYDAVPEALESVGFPKQVRLATNNPRKVDALERAGYEVQERVKVKLPLTDRVARYFRSKVRGLGHHDTD